MKEFKTVYKEVQKEIIEKKSRFIASVIPVKNEEQALDFINIIKAKYWDAAHNVYAYIIGENAVQRYSDDGEPQGTAGIPTLQALKNLGLQDVAIVITRYFGGILLGASGLVRAYGRCAKEGLIEAQIITKLECIEVKIILDYSSFNKIQNQLISKGYIINNIVYEENVSVSILLKEEETEKLKKVVTDIVNINISITVEGRKMISLDSLDKLLEVEDY